LRRHHERPRFLPGPFFFAHLPCAFPHDRKKKFLKGKFMFALGVGCGKVTPAGTGLPHGKSSANPGVLRLRVLICVRRLKNEQGE